MYHVPEHLHPHFARFIISYCYGRKLDNAVSWDWEYISFWAVCCGWGLALSSSQLSPCACHASAQTQSSSNHDFWAHSACWYSCRHLSYCKHKPYASIFVCIYPKYSLFFAARVLKQADSACVCRYRCPLLSVIEDDEEAARVWGYCSWTTYKSKRQSLVIDDVFWRIQPSLNRGLFPILFNTQ